MSEITLKDIETLINSGKAVGVGLTGTRDTVNQIREAQRA
jgi:hypothetical protein